MEVREPDPVEGREATPEEVQIKARNGALYRCDLTKICREFQTHDIYDAAIDLEVEIPTLKTLVEEHQYEFVDATQHFDGINDPITLAKVYSHLVHRARTTKTFVFGRRTPANTPAMLMLQRLEHIRGQVSEFAPIAYFMLVEDRQNMVIRHLVPTRDTFHSDALEFLSGTPVGGVPNIPDAFYSQQMAALTQLLEETQVKGEEPSVPSEPTAVVV